MGHIRICRHIFYQKTVFQWLSKPNFLSFMTKVNPNNGTEIKSDIFHGTYSNLKYFFIGCKILKYFNDFSIGIFQFHCKIEHKKVKWNKVKRNMSKSDSILLCLPSSILFKWLLKFISYLLRNFLIAVSKEKCSMFNFIP